LRFWNYQSVGRGRCCKIVVHAALHPFIKYKNGGGFRTREGLVVVYNVCWSNFNENMCWNNFAAKVIMTMTLRKARGDTSALIHQNVFYFDAKQEWKACCKAMQSTSGLIAIRVECKINLHLILHSTRICNLTGLNLPINSKPTTEYQNVFGLFLNELIPMLDPKNCIKRVPAACAVSCPLISCCTFECVPNELRRSLGLKPLNTSLL